MSTLLLIHDPGTQRDETLRIVEQAELFDERVVARDGVEGLARLLEGRIDVVLCRLDLPGLDGIKLLHMILESKASAAVPVVFLTSRDEPSLRARLLEAGASDVVTKPFHAAELVARLRIHHRRKRLEDDLRVKNETLKRLSTIDALTGLRTRRYLDDVLAIEFLRARRYDSPLSIMLGDLDHFKRVNDRHGHLAGDSALRGVASILLHDLRATDVAGRFGGEEILVVLGQNDVLGSQVLAERWRAAVEEARFPNPEGQPIRVTLSIGIASLDAEMVSPESLIGAADAALYRAKARGRNRIERAGPGGAID